MARPPLEFEAKVTVDQLNKLLKELSVGAEGAAKAVNDALGGTVTKKLVIETQTDESGAKRLVAVERERLSVANAIENQLKQNQKIERGSATSLRQQVNEARQARDAIARYGTSIGSAGKQLGSLNPLWADQNQKLGLLLRQLSVAEASGFWDKAKTSLRAEGFISFLNGLNQITQGLQAASIVVGQFGSAINTLISTAAELQAFELSFKAIGAGAAGASSSLQESAKIALGLGVNLQTVQEGFRQLSPVVLNSGGSLSDVSAIVESLSSRFAAFGISGDKARRVTNGVIQAFAKGKLQAEELTQQISEADPAFKTDLAQALLTAKDSLKQFGIEADGSVQGLEKLVKQGKITPQVLIKVLPGLSKANLLFGKLGPSANSAVDALERNAVTIDQVRGNLANLNSLSLRNVAQAADPLINAFLRAQAIITDFFTRISDSAGVKTLANVFARLVGILNNVVDSFLTLVEGVSRVLDVLAPFIDTILKIPGAIEVAGLALIGKFLKPLGLFDAALKKSISAQRGFVASISSIWKGSQESITIVKNSIKGVTEAFAEKPSLGLLDSANKGLKDVTSNAKDAVTGVESVSGKVTGRIQSQISKTESNIDRLRKKLRLIELESQAAAPVVRPATPTSPAVVQQAAGRQIRQDLAATSESFQQTLRNLDDYDQGLSRVASSSRKSASSIALPAIAIRELRNESGDPIFGRTFSIKPDFLRDVRELSKTDPSKGIRLLQFALRDLRRQFGRVLLDPKFSEESKAFLGRDLIESSNQVKQAIGDIAKQTKNIDVKPVEKLTTAQVKLDDQLTETNKEIIRLRGELSKEPNDKLARKVGNDQALIRAELQKTIEKRKALVAELDKRQVTAVEQRRQSVGFVPGEVNKSTSSLDRYAEAVTKAKQAEAVASSSRVNRIDALTKAYTDRLDEIVKKEQRVGQAIQGFRVPVGPVETSFVDADAAQKARDKIASLSQQRSEYITKLNAQVAAEADLTKALEDGSKATSTYAERQKALGLSRDVLFQSLRTSNKEIDAAKRQIGELQKARDGLLKQQSARPFLGPIDPNTDALAGQIRSLGGELSNLRRDLSSLEGQRQQTSEGIRQLEIGFEENERTANTYGNQLNRLRAGFGNFFRGLTVAPLKAFGGLLKSAGLAAATFASQIGPLPFLLLAIGVASRAYADGTRESSAITKEFSDQLVNLKNALTDLNPEAEEAGEKVSKLGMIWKAISLAAADAGDAIGGFLADVTGKLSDFVQGASTALGPLEALLIKIGLVAAGGALGASVGLVFGPWGAAIGAILGGAAAAFGVVGLEADEASIRIKQLDRNVQALSTSVEEQLPALTKLISELDKLSSPGKGVDPKNLIKFSAGIEQAQKSIDLIKEKIKDTDKTLAENEQQYGKNISKLQQLRKAVALAEGSYKALNESRSTTRGVEGVKFFRELGDAKKKVANLKAELSELENQTIKVGTASQTTKDAIAKQTAQLEIAEKAYQKLAKESGLVIDEQEALTNSIAKLQAAIQTLEGSVGDYDILSPKGRESITTALAQAKALKGVLSEIQKTELEISVELTGFQQQITESQLKIDLEEGPIREAALSISGITNSFALAQQELQTTIAELEFAESQGVVNAQSKAELIKGAATKFLVSSQEAKVAITDASRKFKDDLDNAKSSLQGLIIGKPEFFTPGEIRQNAKQIEADFSAALNKVRSETGDWSWGPKLTGKTYEEILQQKKEFVDTRKQAEDLVESIKNLNKF